MSARLEDWLSTGVSQVKDKPLKWLSEEFFFRDPDRPTYADSSVFLSPADGVIVYQKTVEPAECVADARGRSYSVRDALQDPDFDTPALVIGVFMTLYDVPVNRVPHAGRLSYRTLELVESRNCPMLDMENSIVRDRMISMRHADYLLCNERVINRFFCADLGQHYYVLQIADLGAKSITPLQIKQNQPFAQGERFSQIRFGSQVDLILPISERHDYVLMQQTGFHVEAGIDALVSLRRRD